MARLVAAALSLQVLSAPAIDLQAAEFAKIVEDDDECDVAQGDECALNALQTRAKKWIDPDSPKAALLVESQRELVARMFDIDPPEDFEGNETYEPLPPLSVSVKQGVPPPETPVQYNGVSWPVMVVPGQMGGKSHIFAIGDWGGLDGELVPPDELPRMYVYKNGKEHGPHVFPRSRGGCNQRSLIACFNHTWCNRRCGFVQGVDDKAQLVVAEQFNARAARVDPKFVLNVGDNFYWGGIAKLCGSPMNQIHPATRHQFESIFEEVYKGPGVDGKVWLSVLGNHDWGGRQFSAGWDQQIAYTWASDRWRMPALYWHQPVHFPDYTVDIYMVDTNKFDAHEKYHDRDHNICSTWNRNGSCASCGGPENADTCHKWFDHLWHEQTQWLQKEIPKSNADWQMIVTHFPCDTARNLWKGLHSEGLDLLVTGHRHGQELHAHAGYLGGLTCFVTGGGGGITSEGSPYNHHGSAKAQYGFFDLTISKKEIVVESIDFRGVTVDKTTVHPRHSKAQQAVIDAEIVAAATAAHAEAQAAAEAEAAAQADAAVAAQDATQAGGAAAADAQAEQDRAVAEAPVL